MTSLAAKQAGPVAVAARCFGLTDLGNSERFSRDHAGLVKYAQGMGWLTWDGVRWRRDSLGEVERLAADTVRGIYQEAARGTDPDRRKAIAKWAETSEARPRIEAMLAGARSQLGIAANAAAFDRDALKLNTLSGVLSLQSGDLKDPDPAELVTKVTGAFYNPAALCPRFLTFLDRIMGGKLALIEFLQRAFGYSLGGDTSEQCLFLCHGTGANGKSVLLETLRVVYGDYAVQTPTETLLVSRRAGGGASPDVLRLRGARLVTAVESEQGRHMAEALVKAMTGGDVLAARGLYQGAFVEFIPTFKVWIATNHKPVVKGTDYALWRRVRLIPFYVTIPVAERDRGLKEKLVSESTGILAWAVEGHRQWQAHGLGEPSEVTAATEAYREEMDTLAGFLADRCVVADSLRAPTGALYAEYQRWAKDSGEEATSAKAFSLALQERGLSTAKGTHGQRFFVGIGLSAEVAGGR